MVSRMDDARSVQRCAPLGAAIAYSKRVRHCEHANQTTHAASIPNRVERRAKLPAKSASIPLRY